LSINVQETRDKYYVHPWRRYFAKTIDLVVILTVLGFLGGLVLAFVYPPLLPTSLISTIIFSAIVLIGYCIIEAVLISAFGTTLGKAIFRTGIVNENGQKLEIINSLARSFFCGVAGIGAGIPVVSLMTLIMGYTTLNADGVTPWDQHTGAFVVHEEMTRLNWFFGISIFILAFAANIVLNVASMNF